jgi:competence protein ComEC
VLFLSAGVPAGLTLSGITFPGPREESPMKRLALTLLLLTLLSAPAAYWQANGKLQIHFMDVGQGDGAILISPLGQTVLFDNGKRGKCDLPVSYLQQLGVTKIDYMVASHYHDDHIGCTTEVLTEFPLQKKAFDRGGTYASATYNKYVAKVGAKRQEVTAGQVVILDEGSSSPVRVEFVASNAKTSDGQIVAAANENDRSVVAVVRFGNFDVVTGGDLTP